MTNKDKKKNEYVYKIDKLITELKKVAGDKDYVYSFQIDEILRNTEYRIT